MKEYIRPEIEITKFQVEEIITASGDTLDPDNLGEWSK